MKGNLLLSVLALAAVSGCASLTVRRDYDAEHDFASFKTYTWQHEVQPETGNPRIDNSLLDDRIRRAVNNTLAGKGFRQVDRSDADFLVAYFRDYRSRITGGSWNVGVGRSGYGRYGSVGYGSDISEYDESILTLDILSPEDERTIWRGVGIRTTYEGSSPDKITRIVNKAVSKILKKFPPRQ